MLTRLLDSKDLKPLLISIGSSILVYHSIKKVIDYHQSSKDEWVPVGRVSDLTIYPIKSGKGNKVFSLFCDTVGCRHEEEFDRHMMLFNPTTNHFYTGRQIAEIFKLGSSITDGLVTLTFGDHSFEFSVDSVLKANDLRNVTMYQDQPVECLYCGAEATEWLEKSLGIQDVGIVMFVDHLNSTRQAKTDGFWLGTRKQRKDKIGFSDEAPYHMCFQSSLDELNKRLEKPLTLQTFRANIDIAYTDPWAEDYFDKLKIGDAEFQMLFPCTRCIMTTIDQNDLKRGEEPLATLRKFRMVAGEPGNTISKSPTFGSTASLLKKGHLCLGDTVYAKMRKSFHLQYE